MIEQLVDLAKDIIALSDIAIKDNTSLNINVIKIVKREFEAQYDSLLNCAKAIVLNKEKDLWAARTITDSAYYQCDKELLEKVYLFAELCRKLPLQNLVILYK